MEILVSVQQQFGPSLRNEYLSRYLDNLALLERLHRLMLDVIKDEFERLGVMTINPVQALLLFNIGDNEVTAGELKSRGYYQGSNVTYNLKKLVELGYMHHQRCAVDKRSVRVRLTPQGQEVRDKLADMFSQHARKMQQDEIVDYSTLDTVARSLKKLERYWGDQIRYIY
ncbi:MarR family winged helix-turn-helix transcriptional regulator [Roseinatronobacter bogoriensis]|uniref:MarR family transcriptional regulator n=1 Tax=Roseinatronobacter bogoriensis subsp. barguzinensis TaxID=441209 RepID=A0A2K8KL66_9RHOB|nr:MULTISPECIES: MarR family winged helix-turn-helix transcriptional regulator [Rhodobaca]ATX67898.1 MarR family transcriptional regulator [Rhodobaca barguzinensis]